MRYLILDVQATSSIKSAIPPDQDKKSRPAHLNAEILQIQASEMTSRSKRLSDLPFFIDGGTLCTGSHFLSR